MRTVPAFFSGEVALNGPRVRAGNTLGGLPRPKGPGASQRPVFSQSCDLTEGHRTAQFQAGPEFRAGGDLEGTSGSPSGVLSGPVAGPPHSTLFVGHRFSYLRRLGPTAPLPLEQNAFRAGTPIAARLRQAGLSWFATIINLVPPCRTILDRVFCGRRRQSSRGRRVKHALQRTDGRNFCSRHWSLPAIARNKPHLTPT
jgi:hypothetical protein